MIESQKIKTEYSWVEAEKQVHDLYGLIEKSKFEPEYILPLSNGGGVVLGMLKLLMPHPRPIIQEIPVYRLEDDTRVLVHTQHINKMDFLWKKFLLIEDYLETGQSVVLIKKFVESHGAQMKLACLASQSGTLVAPDFYLEKDVEERIYPWEKFRKV